MKHTEFLRAALLCAVLSLLAIPTLARPVAHGETLASLLLKHRRATNTRAGAQDKVPMQVVYALNAGGFTGTLTEYNAPPKSNRVEMQLGPIHQINADDGKVAWEQDPTGNVRIIQGAELNEDRADTNFSVDTYDPLQKKGKAIGKIVLLPTREPGTGDYILDVLPNGGTRQRIYLDPKTYLIRKIETTKGVIAGTVTILAYRDVYGTKMPSKLQIGGQGVPLVITAELLHAKRGITIPAGFFSPPQAARDFEFLIPGGVGPVVVPFENDNDEIVVPVLINGQKRRFLLDSGAGSSFITAQAAKDLGLTTQGDMPAVGYGGSARTSIATQTTVELPGAVRIKGQLLYVLKDPKIAQALSEKGGVDGALGYDVFARFVVTLDYEKKTITIADPDTVPAKAPPGAFVVPIKLENRAPTVLAAVDSKAVGRFLVDTGDSGAIHLFESYAKANGLTNNPDDPKAEVRQGVGIGGEVSEVVTPGHTLRIGGMTMPGMSVATMAGPGITLSGQLAGGIGNRALSKFRVTFDYPNTRLLLELNTGTIPVQAQPAPAPKASAASTPLVPVIALLQSRAVPLTLAQLLQKHLAALGGKQAVEAIKSTRVTATIQTGGIAGTVTTIYEAPDKEYEEDKLGLLDIQQGYDGKTAWQRDTNGNTRLLAGDELKNLRDQLFIDTNSYIIPGRIPAKMSLRPKTEAKTGDYIIDADPEGGKPMVLFIDPKTFLIAKDRHYDDNIPVTDTYGGYKAVDGVLFPTVQHTTNGNARYDIDVHATKIENNITVDKSLFAVPTIVSKNAMFVQPGATSVTVPIDFDDNAIGLNVLVNGSPAHFILDSGVSGLALAASFADSLKIKPQGTLEARGYGGSTDLHPIKLDTFEIPHAVRLTDITAVDIPLPAALNQILGHPMDGLVGYDLLANFVVRIDFTKKTMTLTDPTVFQPTPADGKAVPIELDGDIPSITAQFDTLPPARFVIDTGDSGAGLRLYGPYVTKNNLLKKYPQGILSLGGGIGGASNSRLTRTQLFTLAGVTFKDVPTDFSLETKEQVGASQIKAGSIGAKLLSRFIVTFDYPRNRMFFATTPETAQPFDTRTFGIVVLNAPGMAGEPHYIVADVQPGAPVIRAGLRRLDEILQIDGQPVATLTLPQVRTLLSPEGGKRVRTLEVQDNSGKPRTIVATLFDPLRSVSAQH